MRNYNPPVHESAPAHPFLAVMNKEYDGHCRLFDRGVTNTLIKKVNGDGSASAVLREIVNHPRYLLHTRPDLSYSVGLLSIFMQDPKEHHLKAVKQVIRYIKGTKEHGILHERGGA
ncbi:ribonuclease H-like domain, reverse transcriptase, RNA-dependent DNA polymerase [Tanacetum coccineum]